MSSESYKIGQYRSTIGYNDTSSSFLSDISDNWSSGIVKSTVSLSDDTTVSFKDYLLTKGEVSTGKSYFISFDVDQGAVSQNSDYNIYLRNRDNNNNILNSQLVKKLTVKKSATESYGECIVYIKDGDLVLFKNWADDYKKVFITDSEEQVEIYGDITDTEDAPTDNIKVNVNVPTIEQSTQKMHVEFIFTPHASNLYQTTEAATSFSNIEIIKERNLADYNIKNTDGTYGDMIEISDMKLYEVSYISDFTGKNVYHFGAWGRSDLIMCLNGEEIRLGPNEYYEYNSSLVPIISVGVVASTYADNFIFNYEYK